MDRNTHSETNYEWREIAATSVHAPSSAVAVAVRIFVDRPHIVNRRLAGIEKIITLHTGNVTADVGASEIAGKWLENFNSHLKLGKEERQKTIEFRELIPRSRDYFTVHEAVVTDDDLQEVTFFQLPPNFLVVRTDTTTFGDHNETDGLKIEEADAVCATRNPTANCTFRISWNENEQSEHKNEKFESKNEQFEHENEQFEHKTEQFEHKNERFEHRNEHSEHKTEHSEQSSLTTVIKISILDSESREGPSEEWLTGQLLPKLTSWAAKAHLTQDRDTTSAQRPSLGLVSVKRYTEALLRLKAKYGQDLVRNWTESTDPQKFVSEDLCIAAYLLTLWGVDRPMPGQKMPSFADLGCGNGLLVYILAREGCFGVGIDVRERKIWKEFRSHARLEERTLDPSTEIFADVDWIIGNHSDELTPWIPYIAAMSSYTCNFFLLPCCAFDFNQKFKKWGNESEYQSYFKYLRQICNVIGFEIEEDTLRIPSTKRNCFVGRKRFFPQNEFFSQKKISQFFVESRLKKSENSSFVVRPAGPEPIKNCTSFSVFLKKNIISKISAELLKNGNVVLVPKGKWNAGRQIFLSDLVHCLDSGTLLQLKKQCGGLQTFIRNHKFIFEIQNAKVQLRNYAVPLLERNNAVPLLERNNAVPKKKSSLTKIPVNLKSKPCWFHSFHPNGCPLEEINCNYFHSAEIFAE